MRQQRPYQHFHTCNFVVSRDVMLTHPFDERFRRYGYEDVLFGKQLKQGKLQIRKSGDNITFTGLDAWAKQQPFHGKTLGKPNAVYQ